MKVSIIIPIFNGQKYLYKSLDSMLNQTYKDIEVILVDDGSTDNSLEICQEYEKKDSRLKIICKDKSEGAGPARNSGMDVATGDLFMFIDADDWISSDMVERLCEEQNKENVDVVICGYETFIENVSDKHNEVIRYDDIKFTTDTEVKNFFVKYFPEGTVGYLWNKIYKASIIKDNNLRFPNMRRLQDGVFNYNYFNCIHSCVVIKDTLYHYRINQQIDMFRKCPKNYYELIKMFSKNYIQIKHSWGNFSNDKIITFFMNELGTCIENAYSPNWNMSRNERRIYFDTIKNDDFLKYAIKLTYNIGKYRKFLIFLLKLNLYDLIQITVKIKTILKMSTKKIYYFIRERT